jgi:hypothetical protein
MSTADRSFENLSPELRQRVLHARAVHDFFQSEIAPRLLASADERERFSAAPTQYLMSAGAPTLADLSIEHRASMDAVLAGPPPPVTGLQCWVCTKSYESVITTIIVVGILMTEVLFLALVTALAGPAVLAAAVLIFLIDAAGLSVGAVVVGPQIEALAMAICKKTGGCS